MVELKNINNHWLQLENISLEKLCSTLPLLSLTEGWGGLPFTSTGFLGTKPGVSHWCWTMWKTPISTADKSGRAAGVKPGSVDIPRYLEAPNELNSVCVTSGRRGGCWYQIEVATSHFPYTFPLFPLVMFHLSWCQCSELLCWSHFRLTRVISVGIFVIVNFFGLTLTRHASLKTHDLTLNLGGNPQKCLFYLYLWL